MNQRLFFQKKETGCKKAFHLVQVGLFILQIKYLEVKLITPDNFT
jgi:hypothetical protein